MANRSSGRAGLATGQILGFGGFNMEGGANAMEGVTTAITGMASSVATNALSVIAAILPVLAPIIAAIIVATLGYKLVKRFSK